MNQYEWNKYRRFQDENEPPPKMTQCSRRGCYYMEFDGDLDVDGLCLQCHDDKLNAKIKEIECSQ